MGLKQLVGALLLLTSFYAGRILPSLVHRNGHARTNLVGCVRRCYIGVLDIYMNPNTLTMMDLLEVWRLQRFAHMNDNPNFQVNTFKLMDCNKAHYDKEIVQ